MSTNGQIPGFPVDLSSEVTHVTMYTSTAPSQHYPLCDVQYVRGEATASAAMFGDSAPPDDDDDDDDPFGDAFRAHAKAVRLAEGEVIMAARWWASDRSPVSGSVLSAAVAKLEAAEKVALPEPARP